MTESDAMTAFLGGQLPAGSVGAAREIRVGDELLLTPAEAEGFSRAVVKVRRASGAARDIARQLCKQIGAVVSDIPRAPDRAPVWPPGIVGSISHDAAYAAAIVASTTRLAGLGLDIEPREHLSEGVAARIGTETELADFRKTPFGEKALFSIKEAVFKAVHPRDRVFLEFSDVLVDRKAGIATIRYGREVHWRVMTEPHVLAIAWW